MPRAAENPQAPEVAASPALSLTARPGDGGIRTRKIALLAADGVDGASIVALQAALVDAGAVARIVAPRIGPVRTADGGTLDADASLENTPPVLFDAVVLPDGQAGVELLANVGQTKEFVVNTYRHCKTLLVLGASKTLTDKLGMPAALPTGEPDPGILFAGAGEDRTADFIAALARHRHPERDSDPPRF